MKTKYRATWQDGNTYPEHGYTYANLKKAASEIKKIAVGNHYVGNRCVCEVMDDDGRTVYFADYNGKRWGKRKNFGGG